MYSKASKAIKKALISTYVFSKGDKGNEDKEVVDTEDRESEDDVM